MIRCYFWVLEISLYQVIKKQGYDEGGTVPSLFTTPSLRAMMT